MTCKHTRLILGKYGDYCETCGALMNPPAEPPQHSSAYYAALADSRALGWRDMGDMPPTDAPYYVAWKNHDESWTVLRQWAGKAPPEQATHWHLDNMGLPLA